MKESLSLRLTRPRVFAALLVCAGALAIQGCAGDGPPQACGSAQFDQIQCQVFNVSCISGSCHGSQSQQGGLNLTAGVSYGQLVGVLSTNVVAQANGVLRVQPFAPESSFLLQKVTNPGVGEGGLMPLAAAPLSSAQIQLIRNWIAAGAPAGDEPTLTPTPSPVPTDTPSPTTTNTPTPSPTSTATPTETLTPTSTATSAPTFTGTLPATATPTITPTVTETPTTTLTPTPTVTPTETPTAEPTATFTIAPGSTLPELQVDIFTPRCAITSCHTDATALFNGDLSLQDGSTYGQLVDVVPQNFTAKTKGYLRVDPFVADNSFLLRKVTGPPPAEGSLMPQIGDPLTAEQIERIRAWIVRGALESEPHP